MQKVEREGIPVHPVVLCVLVVLDLFVRTHLSLLAIGRSLIAAIVIAVLVTAVMSALADSRHVGGLLASAVVALIALNAPVALVAAVVVAAGAWARLALQRPGRVNWRKVAVRANQLSVIIALVIVGSSVLTAGPNQFAADLGQGGDLKADGAASLTAPELPDIYLLLLDGYPRSDWLERLFNADNHAFLAQLAARGFDTYASSRSNYDATGLTLTSMFNMRYLDDIVSLDNVRSGTSGAQPLMRNALNDNEVFRTLHEAGYLTLGVSAGWEELALRRANAYVDSANLNDFEQAMLETTSLYEIVEMVDPSFFARQKRERIQFNLRELKRIADTPTSQPKFVFIHVPAPHYPIVSGQGGVPVDVKIFDWYGFGPDSPSFRQEYAASVEYLDNQLLEAIDAMPESGPRDRVLVLFSDHGSLTDLGGDEERLSTLLVASTPGHSMLFGASPTPVNILRALLTAYLSADHQPLDAHSYRTTNPATLQFREVHFAEGVHGEQATK